MVTTDLPGNQFGQPAELTPGTGAVALSLADEPRVLALDRAAGYAALEVYDTARPTATGHWVDEVLSLGAYLDLLEGAYAHYPRAGAGRARSARTSTTSSTTCRWRAWCARRTACCWRPNGDEPDADAVAAAASSAWWRRRSRYCSETGNIFSGTLYAGLAALVDSATRAGTRVGLYSYGSGSCAEFFAGTLGPTPRATVGARRIADASRARAGALTIDEYETIVRQREAVIDVAHWTPARDLPPRPLRGGLRGPAAAGPGLRQGLLPALRVELTPVAGTHAVRLVLPRRLSWDDVARLRAQAGRRGRAVLVLEGVDGDFCEGGAPDRRPRSSPGRRPSGRSCARSSARPSRWWRWWTGRPWARAWGWPHRPTWCSPRPARASACRRRCWASSRRWCSLPVARRIGLGRARRLALGAPSLTAEEALAQGLVDEIVDDVAAALRTVRRLERLSPQAVRSLKELVGAHFGTTTAYEVDAAAALQARLASAETRERLARFAEGGSPWPDDGPGGS